MTDIRTNGFASSRQFQEHLDDLVEEGRDAEPADEFSVEQQRLAQVEIAWLRREISDLRESIAVANGNPRDSEVSRQNRQVGRESLLFGIASLLAAAFLWRKIAF